jgi:hypothetical protein
MVEQMELPAGYAAVLAELKDQIKAARLKGLAFNHELVLLHWRIWQADFAAATSGGMGL